jgi:hypothetical protein
VILSAFNMTSIYFKIANPQGFSAALCGCGPRPFLGGVMVILIWLASGCSNSIAPAQAEGEQGSELTDADLQSQSPVSVAVPVAILDLQAGSTLIAPVPAITSIEVLAESGLQVAYTQSAQNALVSALSVEVNWLHMQTCLHQVGVAPLVLIRSSGIAPFTSADDVIHTIDGIPAASVSMGSIPVIQIGVSDFLMTGDAYGYNLRSIMGRLLWSSAGLSARDYPYYCAHQLAESK